MRTWYCNAERHQRVWAALVLNEQIQVGVVAWTVVLNRTSVCRWRRCSSTKGALLEHHAVEIDVRGQFRWQHRAQF